MRIEEFRKSAHQLVDWMADYLDNIEKYPVKSPVKPRDIYNQIPSAAPSNSESFETIFEDFKDVIIPGITHWQHPGFMAYFNGNSSPPSVLGEMLISTLNSQCMMWLTSPAAAELEERMMEWLKQMLSLPEEYVGVIQDCGSTSNLISILTARERISDYRINQSGFGQNCRYAVYCSTETHSSMDKAVKIAGMGADSIRKIEVDNSFAMIPEKLEEAIKNDIDNNIIPLCIVGTIGTTSSCAVDPVEAMGKIARKYNIWFHVDAAFAGTALMLEEKRWMGKGMEYVDTFVFNPHKWMFTNLDCSAYFVKNKEALIRTFEILPEYLKTKEGKNVNDYRDWGIALGRRFRALKLWFVIRSYGVEGLKEKIRYHIKIAENLRRKIDECEDFEMLAPMHLSLLCFRYKPANISDEEKLNAVNEQLLQKIVETGQVFMTHTKLNGKFTLRMVTGQTYITEKRVEDVWDLINKLTGELKI